jgi:xanthine dehydrogenase large subunit
MGNSHSEKKPEAGSPLLRSPYQDSSHTHVTGESEFIDDRPRMGNELEVQLILSPVPHGRIDSLPSDEELKKIPGVSHVFRAKDFPHLMWGTIFQDQPLLADTVVRFAGEPLLILAGPDRALLQAAVAPILKRIKITPLPSIQSIAEARAQNSFIADGKSLKRGDAEAALKTAPFRKTGKVVLKGADHFYLESQASITYPLEDGQLEVHSSSQHPTEVQHVVAHSLGLPSSDVTSIMKRMGGGFGGKESQAAHFAALGAIVAWKSKQPARLVLTKDEDMISTGKRNPFEIEFDVGFTAKGEILGLKAELYSDGGAYADLSTSILERALLHCDNAYYIPNIHVTGRVCRTHHHPHTAFRGFGGPKGVALIESVIEEIAHTLKIDSLSVRKINLYAPGKEITHYGQQVENNVLPELVEKLEQTSQYRKRRKEILEKNRNTLEDPLQDEILGLSLTPVKFGISFTTRFLNQANATVLIHRDGTFQITTGATEMGQGVHSRIRALVADTFGVSTERIRVMPTRTDKNPNTSPTAASSGTDLNGAAAVIAAEKIRGRLEQMAVFLLKISREKWPSKVAPLNTADEIVITDQRPKEEVIFQDEWVFLKSAPENRISFSALVNETYLSRVSLSDTGYFKTPNLDFNKVTGQGRAFLYYTQGAAVTEVSLSRVTGEVKVLRTDILMDLGKPILEDLDRGQITGAFVQGMGWMTTENLFYSRDGLLLSHSPSTYKIPSIQDTPRDFRVDLFPNEGNTVNVARTKAVGEPPLLLSLSVWTAIQDALCSLPEFSAGTYPRLPVPATQEIILRAMSGLAPVEWTRLP